QRKVIALELYPSTGERLENIGEHAICRIAMHEECFSCVTYARTVCLCVVHNTHSHIAIGRCVNIHVNNAGTSLDDRNGRFLHHCLDECSATPRNEHINIPACAHECVRAFATEIIDRLECISREPYAVDGTLHNVDEHLVG